MKTQFAWIVMIIVELALLLSLSPVSLHATQSLQIAANGSPSNEPPTGYKPTPATQSRKTVTAGGGADILLVQTALPWDSDANTQVLGALGYAYDIVDMGNIAQVDLFRYPVILIVNDQVQAFYDQYAAQIAAFERYVAGGGTLVFFASSDGWANGTLSANLPGGVTITTPWYEYNNYIADNTHPIVSANLSDGGALVDADLYSDFCSHGYFSALPDNAKIILRESHGYPTLVEYEMGQGRVIASTLTWEHNWAYRNAFGRKALDDVFLYAFSSSGVVDGIINVFPDTAPADGTTLVNVTLAGATPGHRVRLISSRGSIDTFANATGVANNLGRFATTLRSTTAGLAVLTAQDLTTGQTFPASASVNFTDNGQSPSKEEIVITGVQSDCGQTECPVDGFFLLGLRGLHLPLRVNVDWKGNRPDSVDFSINGYTSVISAVGQSNIIYKLDINERLREGPNVLQIVARSGDKASKAVAIHLFGYQLPQWLKDGVDTLPSIGNQALILELAFPSSPLCKHQQGRSKQECEEFQFGFLPGDLNHFQWQTNIKMSLPTRGGAFELAINRKRDHAQTGRKPKALLKLIGHEFDLEYGGNLKGVLGETAPYVIVQDLEFNGSISTELSKDVGIPDALNALPPFGPVAYQAISIVPPVRDWLNDRAKLYAKITPELSGKFALTFQPSLHVNNAQISLDFPFELGAKADLWAVEGHIYGGLGGKGTFGYSTDDIHIASAQAYGFGGYKFRLAWFTLEDTGEWKLLGYPSESDNIGLAFASTVKQPLEWQIIRHSTVVNYTNGSIPNLLNRAFSSSTSSLRSAGLLAPQSTITSVLVSNVYTYTEPTLAMNPDNSQALLLWTHDDINKPVGQAHEIAFSRWDGATWSTPAGVTNDDRLDSAPQVTWAGDGKAVAVWQRLNESLSPTATLDLTTTRKLEIATATYDPTTNQWSPVALLTNDQALAMTPTLVRNNHGNVLAVWRQNEAGLLGGDAANPDRINAAFYQNSWGTPQIAVDAIPGLVDLAAGLGNNQAMIAYTQYLTATGSMTPTLQLFTSIWNGATWSAPMQRTNDTLGHRTPQMIYTTANEPVVVWLAGHELRMQNLVSNVVMALSLPTTIGTIDEFRVIQDAVGNVAAVFTAQSGQRDLFVAFYDQAHQRWGLPTPLTQDHHHENYPAPTFSTDGRLLLAYAATAVTSVAHTMTTQAGETFQFTVPTEGQTDLMTLAYRFIRNATLQGSNFTVSDEHPAPEQTVTLAAIVTNTGDLALAHLSVTFYDGDPAGGGTWIGKNTLAAPLAAGLSATLTTSYTVPANGSLRQLYAVVDEDDQIVEANEADNHVQRAFFGPDLALTGVGVRHWGGNAVDLISQIHNIGTTTSPTATIAYYQDAHRTTLALTDTIPAISAGAQVTLTTPWNHPALASGSHSLFALVNPLSLTNFAEVYRENNSFTATIQAGVDLMVSPYDLQTTPLTATTVAFTVTLANVGNAPAEAALVQFYRRGDLAPRHVVASVQAPPLSPGETAVLVGEVTGPLGCGLYVLANPARVFQEISQGNNLIYASAPGGQCASFYNTPYTAIAPATVIFTDTSTGANSAWLWAFGDGTTSTEQHPFHQYAESGSYTVTLTVNSSSGTDSYSLPNAVRIYQQAQADFTAGPMAGKAPLLVSFVDHSSGDIQSWLWDFGDGNYSVERNPVHNYVTAGTYTVTLTVSGDGGTNSVVKRDFVTVMPTPATMRMQTAPSTLTADGVSTANVLVTVLSSKGEPMAGEMVQFVTTLGSITGQALTNRDGVATALLTSSTKAGIALITAQAGTIEQTVEVSLVAGPPATIAQNERLVVLADGASKLEIAVTIYDAYRNPVEGQGVEFSTTLGTITNAATTNAQGIATATFTAAATPGTAIVTAKAGTIIQTFEITLVNRQTEIFLPLIKR